MPDHPGAAANKIGDTRRETHFLEVAENRGVDTSGPGRQQLGWLDREAICSVLGAWKPA